MIRYRLGRRVGEDRGFTLIELIITMIMIGILAAIAVAVFLNQRERANDSKTKSNITNLAHEIQSCAAGNESSDDYRNCDDANTISGGSFKLDPTVNEVNGNCQNANATLNSGSVASGFEVKINQAGPDCYTILGVSTSGNRFVYIKSGNTVTRDCRTRGNTGCPANGQWAG